MRRPLPARGRPARDRPAAASQAMLDSLSDPFIWLDPEWRVRYLNPAAARLLGRPAELAGHNVGDSYPDLAGSGYHDACRAVAATASRRPIPIRAAGVQPERAPFRRVTASSWCCAMCRTHRQIRLRYQATHDYLTGLPNRRQLMDTLSGAIAEAAAGPPAHAAGRVVPGPGPLQGSQRHLRPRRGRRVAARRGRGCAASRPRPSSARAPAATSSRWYCATPPNAPPRRWPTPC